MVCDDLVSEGGRVCDDLVSESMRSLYMCVCADRVR